MGAKEMFRKAVGWQILTDTQQLERTWVVDAELSNTGWGQWDGGGGGAVGWRVGGGGGCPPLPLEAEALCAGGGRLLFV